jgi:hypothetical protein
MGLLDIIHLIFWVGTLIGWVFAVAYGCCWFERSVDRLLDRWFYLEETDEDGLSTGGNVRRRFCWISYLDKK